MNEPHSFFEKIDYFLALVKKKILFSEIFSEFINYNNINILVADLRPF